MSRIANGRIRPDPGSRETLEVQIPNYAMSPQIADQLSDPNGETAGIMVGKFRTHRHLQITDDADPIEVTARIICVEIFREGDVFDAMKLHGEDSGPDVESELASWLVGEEKIVGWYRFVRGPRAPPTLHDWIIHDKMLQNCEDFMSVAPEFFTFLMFNSFRDKFDALTHTCTAWRYERGRFVGIPVPAYEKRGNSILGRYIEAPIDFSDDVMSYTSSYERERVEAVVSEGEKLYSSLSDELKEKAKELSAQQTAVLNAVRQNHGSDYETGMQMLSLQSPRPEFTFGPEFYPGGDASNPFETEMNDDIAAAVAAADDDGGSSSDAASAAPRTRARAGAGGDRAEAEDEDEGGDGGNDDDEDDDDDVTFHPGAGGGGEPSRPSASTGRGGGSRSGGGGGAKRQGRAGGGGGRGRASGAKRPRGDRGRR